MKTSYVIVGIALVVGAFMFLYVQLNPAGIHVEIPAAQKNDSIIHTSTSNPMTKDSATSSSAAETAPVLETEALIVFRTNRGDITLQLFTKEMPVTTANFLTLARAGFYDGVKFHRVIDGFMIQGGDPLTKDDTQKARWGTGGPGYAIPDEFAQGLSNVRGTIAMANAGPNTGGSQFFINTADNTFLDGKHPVFGKVTSGMDVVDAIAKTETGQNDTPIDAVVINTVAFE